MLTVICSKCYLDKLLILLGKQLLLYKFIWFIFSMFNIFSNFSVVVRILSELLAVVVISQRRILVGEEG